MSDWVHQYADVVESILCEQPGLTNTMLRAELRKHGVFLDARALGTILHSDSRFRTLGDHIPGWFLEDSLAADCEPPSSSDLAGDMNERSKAVWDSDTTAEEILRLLDGP